eukprot:TRINITY_DN1507_c0_g1_i1.p2 TRINITY_DN1507_c0_g1~~TRINITY_DN1507_c0_g1_i1.p2  ORF type:complete len:424 (+),score=141.89 TRINITY_DN1507_c0_g1_i1:101-1372(+)
MSYRELRNFCEIMRSLGYHRLISMENFRQPNFELTADILDWLLHRFEPSCQIPDDIRTEAHRVEFVKAVCAKVVARNGIKLNARKLYNADGRAVQEILKLANVLYDAQNTVARQTFDEGFDDSPALHTKLSDVLSARSMCSEVVETGAGLFDLLQREPETSKDREKALRFLDGLSRNLDSNSEHEAVERAVTGMLGAHAHNLSQLQRMTEELKSDERALDQKIKKKKQELDRCTKRLASLANVRPAFMDEYEQLEQEFERYYEEYIGRFRNLDYLEHEVDALNREQTEQMEENERRLKNLQKRLRDEEWALLKGEDDDGDGRGGKMHRPKRGPKSHNPWMPPNSTAFEGSMDAGDEDEVSGSDSDPPISIAGSESDDEDPAVSIGDSGHGDDDHDIMSESEDDISEDDPAMRHRRLQQSDNDF